MTYDDTIMPIIKGWEIIEQALIELGVTGDHNPMFRSRAEAGAKAIVARLAAHEPPILFCFPHQLKEGDGQENKEGRPT